MPFKVSTLISLLEADVEKNMEDYTWEILVDQA